MVLLTKSGCNSHLPVQTTVPHWSSELLRVSVSSLVNG